MCARCGKAKPREGRSDCQGCSDKRKQGYQQRVSNGVCVKCSKPSGFYVLCETHRHEVNERYATKVLSEVKSS